MKPGVTSFPAASITRRAGVSGGSGSTAAMTPPSTATSAEKPGGSGAVDDGAAPDQQVQHGHCASFWRKIGSVTEKRFTPSWLRQVIFPL